MRYTSCAASTLRAILCYINPPHTPHIAFDKDEYAEPLIDKVTQSVGDKDGSERVIISFGPDEVELHRQFVGVCRNIQKCFGAVVFVND